MLELLLSEAVLKGSDLTLKQEKKKQQMHIPKIVAKLISHS